MLQGKKILLGVTGSIAAYKTATLVRLLIKAGAEVKVLMTPAAADFITPLTLSTLSRNPVITGFATEDTWSNHVMLGRWADIMLVAPLSCNTLAKMAHGQCDTMLLAVYLSATCPVVVAPAMDEDMWKHPSTNENIDRISRFGVQVIPVESGELASGLTGDGRMAEPETILQWLEGFFLTSKRLLGKKALVTAGPTYEPIDPVRFIGNHSSGKMGIALAETLARQGATVTLVLGPVEAEVPASVDTIRVNTAAEMYDQASKLFPETDIAIMAAAVADYTPVTVHPEKIKKKEGSLTLELTKTKDILGTLGQQKKPHQVLVGFALETNNETENALQKLSGKQADLIVLNSLNDPGAGFRHATNKITIFDRQGNTYPFETKSKSAVAADIVNTITQLFYAK